MIQKDVRQLLESDRALRYLLDDLRSHTMRLPSKKALLPFARASLGVEPEQEADWFRNAWWGYYASLLVRKRLRRGKLEEVMDLVEPIDWRPLDSALEAGKGALLVTAHVGLSRLCVACVEQSDYPVLRIHGGRSGQREQRSPILPVTTPEQRKIALVKSMTQLRRGGVIICAPDGRYGENFFLTRFLGQQVKIFSGLGDLARITGSPTLWFTASWAGDNRIRLSLTPFEKQGETSPEKWNQQWYRAYLHHLGNQLRSNPADLGLKKGLWQTAEGGLSWHHASSLELALSSSKRYLGKFRRALAD